MVLIPRAVDQSSKLKLNRASTAMDNNSNVVICSQAHPLASTQRPALPRYASERFGPSARAVAAPEKSLGKVVAEGAARAGHCGPIHGLMGL